MKKTEVDRKKEAFPHSLAVIRHEKSWVYTMSEGYTSTMCLSYLETIQRDNWIIRTER